MRSKRVWIKWLALAGAAAIVGGMLFLEWMRVPAPGPERAVTPVPREPTASRRPTPQHLKSLVQGRGGHKRPGPLPHSLMGTTAPGGWARIRDGQLEPTPALRELFEYYLSALGEESLATTTWRIRQALSVLPEPARGQALTILLHYLDYRLALGQLGSDGSLPALSLEHPQTLAIRLQQLDALRRDKLGPAVAEAFFGREQALNNYTLARLRIGQDAGLTSAQKAVALAAARAQLPESEQRDRRQTLKFERYRQTLAQLRRDGAGQSRIQALREQTFGPEAASRLAALDRRRADWHRRWTAYRRAEAGLRASGLSPQARGDQLQQLRARYFKDAEMARVRALDADLGQ